MIPLIPLLIGKRTYIAAAGLVVTGGLYQQGYITEETYRALEALMLGGGLAALRAGIARER